ncbi:hypothetical protein KY321_04425, partial [Candidatus Woesearchaeota archaeon]|nr:hypothetical protein [Candidatus Woesearchaeota archaeon]
RDVQEAISREAQDKEIGTKFDFGFGKRPDVITGPGDVAEFARQRITSFHFSEENWLDPLAISSDLSRKELDALRKGWDLIIDLDTPYFEYSKIIANLIIEFLKYQEIESITCKFSGNHGFHIAIPFEAFPEKVFDGDGSLKDVRISFPEGPRIIAFYLREAIHKHFKKRLLEMHSEETIANNLNCKVEDLETNGEFDPFKVVEIDTVLISSRHLCRMPYSFNEKSGLISIPVDIDKVMEFKREDAKPENIKEILPFLKREDVRPGEASNLFQSAYAEHISQTKSIYNVNDEKVKKEVDYEELAEAIPIEHFPPCIKLILNGIDDGKKRALFILINFLSSAGYGKEATEQLIYEWNKKNPDPLRETYVKTQLSYYKNKGGKLPPNCESEAYYKGILVCKPDELCKHIKNPISYAKAKYFKAKTLEKNKPKKKEKSDAEPKEGVKIESDQNSNPEAKLGSNSNENNVNVDVSSNETEETSQKTYNKG